MMHESILVYTCLCIILLFKMSIHSQPNFTGIKLELRLRSIYNLLNAKKQTIRHAEDLKESSIFPSKNIFSSTKVPSDFFPQFCTFIPQVLGALLPAASSCIFHWRAAPGLLELIHQEFRESRECLVRGGEQHLVRMPRGPNNKV